MNPLIFIAYKFRQRIMEEGLKNTFYRLLKVVAIRLSYFKREFLYKFYKLFYGTVTKEILGSVMYLDLKDKGISKDLLIDGKREILSTDYLISSGILEQGDVVLDIGANIGYYALLESNLVGDNGTVYAVEPFHSNFVILKRNIALNRRKNMEAFNLAMGDSNGKSVLYITQESNLCRMGMKPEEIIGKQIVDVLTVDVFLEGKDTPNLIRMDVEGYEYNIIMGMKKTLTKDVKILVEVHPDILTLKKLKEMFSVLKQNNFQIRFAILDIKHKRSIFHKVVKHFMYKLGEKEEEYEYNSGVFLKMNMDELFKWLMKTKVAVHVCFDKVHE